MIQIIAMLCSLSNPTDCHEQIVAASPEISMTSCMMGAPQISEWMKDHPNERLAGWRCMFGKRVREI